MGSTGPIVSVQRVAVASLIVCASAVALFFMAPGAHAEAGDGRVMYQSCVDNDCSKLENQTGLYWQGGRMGLMPGFRGLEMVGYARLRIAADGSQDSVASVVDVTATLSWPWGRSSWGVNLQPRGPWENAFGMQGLTLTDFEVSGAVSFWPWANFGNFDISATAELPPLWNEDFAVVVNHPVSLDASFTRTTPALAIEIGAADSDPSLRPLEPSGIPEDNLIVAIDSGSLVVAPQGATLNGVDYDPGVWLGFAGSVGGYPVGIDAQYDPANRRLSGSGHLDRFDAGAVSLRDWALDFDLAPGDVDIDISGGIDVVGGPSLDVSGAVYSTPGCVICVDFTGTAADFDLGSVHFDTMSVDVTAEFNDASTLNADVSAQVGLLGEQVDVQGALSVADENGTVFAISGSTSAVCFATGTCMTGSGPLGGPQFSGTYDSAQPNPLAVSFDGAVTAEDFSVAIAGALNDEGAWFTGSMLIEGIVDVSVSGQFYQGSNLQGLTILDGTGSPVAVQDGDWRADAVGLIDTTLSGARFKGQLDFDAGSIAGDEWVNALGQVNVTEPERMTDFDASVSGTFASLFDGTPDYTLYADMAGEFRGFDSTGTATVTPGSIDVAAQAYVPDLEATIGFSGNATFDCVSGPECVSTYNFTGYSDFELNGINASGTFTIDSETGISAVVDAGGTKDGMGFNAHFDTSIPDGGSICADASANAWIDDVPHVDVGRADFAGSVNYCDRNIQGQLFSAVSFTMYTGEVFDIVGWVRGGVDASATLQMDVDNDGFVVEGSGDGSVFTEEKFLFTNTWTARIDWFDVDLEVANNTISAWVNVLFWDMPLFSEYFPYLTGTFEGWS